MVNKGDGKVVRRKEIEHIEVETEDGSIPYDSFIGFISDLDLYRDFLEEEKEDDRVQNISLEIRGVEEDFKSYEELEEFIRDLSSNLNMMRASKNTYQNLFEEISEEKEELKEVKNQLIKEKEKYKRECKELKKNNKKLHKKLEKLSNKIRDAVSEYKTDPDDIEVTREDIGGVDDKYEEIRKEILLPLGVSEAFGKESPFKDKGGVLLHGPPGTGKTHSLKAIAKEAGINLYLINGPEIVRKYVGKSAEKLRDIANAAMDDAPSLIVLEEIDSLAGPRGSSSSNDLNSRIIGTLNSLMDGFEENERVYWAATTNRPDQMDSALVRPGRFTKIEYDRPGEKATYDIAAIHLPEEVYEKVADKITSNEEYMEVNSGAAIEQIKEKAGKTYLLDRYRDEGEDITEISDGNIGDFDLEDIDEEYFLNAVDAVYKKRIEGDGGSHIGGFSDGS
ncbi:MAG: AAA family ATPase [Candidatus Nanohaloarchaea archaeon]|nr:AAA family ATPase [Candidatus Nanohaloarchaea archaeon]